MINILGNCFNLCFQDEFVQNRGDIFHKVSSVQESCAKYFEVHILNLKSCKPHEKTKQSDDVLCFIFFM